MFMATQCCKLRFEGGILQLMDAGREINDLFIVDDAFYNFACDVLSLRQPSLQLSQLLSYLCIQPTGGVAVRGADTVSNIQDY